FGFRENLVALLENRIILVCLEKRDRRDQPREEGSWEHVPILDEAVAAHFKNLERRAHSTCFGNCARFFSSQRYQTTGSFPRPSPVSSSRIPWAGCCSSRDCRIAMN